MIQQDLEPFDNSEDAFSFKFKYEFTMAFEDAILKFDENSIKESYLFMVGIFKTMYIYLFIGIFQKWKSTIWMVGDTINQIWLRYQTI